MKSVKRMKELFDLVDTNTQTRIAKGLLNEQQKENWNKIVFEFNLAFSETEINLANGFELNNTDSKLTLLMLDLQQYKNVANEEYKKRLIAEAAYENLASKLRPRPSRKSEYDSLQEREIYRNIHNNNQKIKWQDHY